MRAIFGLGNPGNEYQRTRHNIGFNIVDFFIQQRKSEFKPGKGQYYFARIRFAGSDTILIKPTTFMNLSGQAVVQVMNRFRVHISDILVIYDDFHIPFGTFRFRKKGSDGGHNGVSSIIYELGTEDFDRFRFGIGQTENDTISYVLSEFAEQEIEDLNILLPKTKEAIGCWLRRGIETTMNQYNRSFVGEEKDE